MTANRAASVLCILAASIFGALAVLVLATKMTDPSVWTVLYFTAFVAAAVACYRAAARRRRPNRRDV